MFESGEVSLRSERHNADRRAAADRVKATRDREADAARRRQGCHDAELAAVDAGAALTLELRMQIWHIVDLAAADPPMELRYASRGTWTAELLGARNGVSLGRQHIVVDQPITGPASAAGVLHEIGHQRDKTRTTSRLIESEVTAWRYAMKHALVWDVNCLSLMRWALGTYIVPAKLKGKKIGGAQIRDAADVYNADVLCSEDTFNNNKRAIEPAALEAFEARVFRQEHGRHFCEHRMCRDSSAVAVARVGGAFVCRSCKPHAIVDEHIRRRARLSDPAQIAADNAVFAEYKRQRAQRGRA